MNKDKLIELLDEMIDFMAIKIDGDLNSSEIRRLRKLLSEVKDE